MYSNVSSMYNCRKCTHRQTHAHHVDGGENAALGSPNSMAIINLNKYFVFQEYGRQFCKFFFGHG